MTVRVGINGFGRIGRNFWRAAAASGQDIEIVAVNDLTSPEVLAHLLKYDSILGKLSEDVEADGEGIKVAGNTMKVLSERDPASLPWGDLGVVVFFVVQDIVADPVLVQRDLLVVLLVHEDIILAILVEILHGPLVKEGDLDLVFRLETPRRDGAGFEVLEL